MMWFVYNVLFLVGFTAMLPKFLVRMWRRGGYRRGFMQRLGVYDADLLRRLGERPRVWIHAVSVGEIFVAGCYVAELRRRRSGEAFVLSTNTSTGHNVARRFLGPEDVLLYFPVDFPPVVRRVLERLRPTALILTECELWPNVIRGCGRRGIPVFLVNGRISGKSYRGYKLAKPFFKDAVNRLDLLCVQGEGDAWRLRDLGVEPARIRVTGTAKYDVAEADPKDEERAREVLLKCGVPAGAAVLVGGSTWPGEEAALLDVYRKLAGRFPDLRLVLVPRHAERGDAVEAEIKGAGLECVRRSRLDRLDFRPPAGPAIILVDTTGELKGFYAAATVIFVGKSLGSNHGGQNVIEPACWGKPVIVGPNMENFEAVVDDFRAKDAIVQAPDVDGLERAVESLLRDEAARAACGRRAREVVDGKRGTVRSTVDLIEDRLRRRGAAAAPRG